MIELAESSADVEPESALANLEPLLTPAEVATYMKVSPWYVNHYARRKHDPLPLRGTARARRAKPSEIQEWMLRNNGAD